MMLFIKEKKKTFQVSCKILLICRYFLIAWGYSLYINSSLDVHITNLFTQFVPFFHLFNSLLMRRLLTLNIKIFYVFFSIESTFEVISVKTIDANIFHICFLSEVLAFTFKSMNYLKLILLYFIVWELKITFFYIFIQLSQFTCWREFLFSIKKCQFILWAKFSFTHWFIPVC